MEELPQVEPVKIYENTYVLPEDAKRFKKSAAEQIMKEVLEEKLAYTNERDKKGRLAFTYDPEEIADLCRDISAECIEKIKENNSEFGLPRFKLICQASVGENNAQSMRNISRCLWDPDIDRCATATWTNSRVYAVAMCFALYYE